MKYPNQSDYEYNAKNVIVDLFYKFDEYINELEGKHELEIEELKAQIEALEEQITNLESK
jgi:polyhydroxyalkanoate synthesis regulator phasin